MEVIFQKNVADFHMIFNVHMALSLTLTMTFGQENFFENSPSFLIAKLIKNQNSLRGRGQRHVQGRI